MGRPRLHTEDPKLLRVRASARAKTARAKERKRPVFRKIINAFLDNPCVDCGIQYPRPAMEADHVLPKKYKISWFRDGNGSEKALLEELARCEVRCANCHNIRHAASGASL